jgi:hypothetical protein
MIQDYYVNYWCADWRDSPRLPHAQAEELAKALRSVGAQANVVAVITPDDIPTFPDPSQDYEVDRVQFRRPALQSDKFPNRALAEMRQAQLRALGLDVQVTEGAALAAIPRTPSADPPEILGTSWWSGTVGQVDRPLSAQLVLRRTGPAVEGELSAVYHTHLSRAKVRGELQGDRLHLLIYERIVGDILVPMTYDGQLTSDGRFSGVWEHKPQHLSGQFDFALTRTE